MQEYGKAAYRGIISKPLQAEITAAVENGNQVILLMNRRGFSTYTQCKSCGTVVECPDCSIPMVWHSDGKKLKCHYCNKEMSFPDYCPTCGSDAISNSGSGSAGPGSAQKSSANHSEDCHAFSSKAFSSIKLIVSTGI